MRNDVLSINGLLHWSDILPQLSGRGHIGCRAIPRSHPFVRILRSLQYTECCPSGHVFRLLYKVDVRVSADHNLRHRPLSTAEGTDPVEANGA